MGLLHIFTPPSLYNSDQSIFLIFIYIFLSKAFNKILKLIQTKNYFVVIFLVKPTFILFLQILDI